MGGKQTRPNIDQREYQQRFKDISRNCQQGPVQQRSCKDICCLITFIVITLLFIGVGAYFIVNARNVDFTKLSSPTKNSTSPAHQFNPGNHELKYQVMRSHEQKSAAKSTDVQFSMKDIPNMRPAIPYILAMGVLAIVVSFLVIIGVSKIPKCMIYSMIVITFVLLVVGIVVSIIFKVYAMAIAIGIVLAIWLCIFCCLRKQLQVGITLLKVTGSFITAKPTVLLAPVFVLFFSIFYFAFWLTTFIAIQLSRPEDPNANSATLTTKNTQDSNLSVEDILTIVWMFFSVFYTYFLYYVMVFLIATAAGLWYYGLNKNYLTTGLRWIWNSHIGSFTFAAMVVAIIDMLKSAAEDQRQQSNGAGAICYCLLACCLNFIEQIVKVLNHNAIIVMSVTAQSYIDSAKSALILIYQNFSLFVIIDIVSSLLHLIGFLFIVAIPSVIGFFLLKNASQDYDQDTQMLFITMGVIIIVLISGMVSSIVVTTVTQALSSVFIFFCLDQKFRAYNYGAINRVPQDMRGLFKQMQDQGALINHNQFD